MGWSCVSQSECVDWWVCLAGVLHANIMREISLSVCLCALRETARFVGTLFLIKHSTNIVILNQTVFFPKRNHTFSALATQNIVGKRGIHSTRCVCGQKLSDFQYKKITTEYDHMYGMCLLNEISMTMKSGSIK